jgi:hypothetical protein
MTKLFADEKEKYNEYYLLEDIFKKIEENENKCSQSKLKLFENQTCKFLKYFNYDYYPKNDEERKQLINKLDEIFKNFVEKGKQGEIRTGKISKDDITYLIKKPINDEEGLMMESIKESYINICIINDIILETKSSHNLIFTYGLFILKYNLDPLSIFIIQQPLIDAKQLYSVIETIDVHKYFKYLVQVFQQLSILEKSPYQLIHSDLHSKNILIFEDNAYIIDWGKSSFLYNDKRIRNKQEDGYFKFDKTHKKKSGLYDIYLLLRTSYTDKKNELIDEFILTILKRIIFNNIYIYDKTTKKSKLLEITDAYKGGWLYPIIGGYVYEIDEKIEYYEKIYEQNEIHFDKYTYSEILKVIKEVYYQKYGSEIKKNKCKKLN